MFKTTFNGRNNNVGIEIARRRKLERISQRELSDRMRKIGSNIDKNGIQRIEAGERFVTDIELLLFAMYFDCNTADLYTGVVR